MVANYPVLQRGVEGMALAMMSGTDEQQRGFKDRLGRISKGGTHTTRHVHVGPVEEAVTGRKGKARDRTIRLERKRGFFSEMFIVPMALVAGMLAVLAARVLGFHYLLEFEMLNATIAGLGGLTFAVGAMAIVLLLAFRSVFRLKGGARGKAVLVGFLGMSLFEDLLVVRAPELFAMIYSDTYVANLIAVVAT